MEGEHIHNGQEYQEWKFPIYLKLQETGEAYIKLISQNEFLSVINTGDVIVIQYSNKMGPAQCAETVSKLQEATAEDFDSLFNAVKKVIL